MYIKSTAQSQKSEEKKTTVSLPESCMLFFYFFNFNLSLIIQFFKLFNILHAWKCLSVFSSFFLYFTRNHKSRAERLEDKEERSGHDCLPHTCTTCVHTQRVQGPAGVTE